MPDVNCPYCGAGNDIDHDDGYGYQEDTIHRQGCSTCGSTFTYTTSIMYCYEAEQAPCLNGGEHDWHPTVTYPKEFIKMACSICDDRREPDESERIKYQIPSKTS